MADFEGGVSVKISVNVVEIKAADKAPLLVMVDDDGVGEMILG